MQIGVSSYSFAASIAAGRIDILGAIDWVADHDAAHLELAIAGLGSEIIDDPQLVAAIKQRAAERGVPLVNYVVGADFRSNDLDGEIARVKQHLDVAAELGITRFRHDVTEWGWAAQDQQDFEATFARVVPVVQQLADYAAGLGITTSVENHGMAFNDPERIARLVLAVDRENFKTTLDVGNFLCVAADPIPAVRRLLPQASVVHLKDFRIRAEAPGDGWLQTTNDDAILGTVVGWGDLPLLTIVADIAEFGFDGPISIEFEGPEDDLFAIEEGLKQAKALFAEVED